MHPPEYYQSIPKVDLHRHLEGSLRVTTMAQVAREMGLNLPNTSGLRPLVQIGQEEPYTFQNFLSKFDTLRQFYRSPEIISRITSEAVEDAAADNIRYLEMRFTPVALSRAEGFSMGEVIDWVIDGAKQACQKHPIQVGLIVSVNRHESTQLAEQVIGLAADRRRDGILGVDLAGNEAQYSAKPFAAIFREAKQEGMHISVHAGEWGPGENVAEAILHLGAERIGHGIRVLEHPYSVAMARERGIAFEVCVTSNHQSGVIQNLCNHPITKMLAEGLNVAICTDDPSISNITLSHEYEVICEQMGVPEETLKQRIQAAAKSSFLPDDQKQKLVESFRPV